MGRESNGPILVVLGTRPEIVKLALIARILGDDGAVSPCLDGELLAGGRNHGLTLSDPAGARAGGPAAGRRPGGVRNESLPMRRRPADARVGDMTDTAAAAGGVRATDAADERREIGRQAMTMLLARLADEDPGRTVRDLGFRLVMRDSTRRGQEQSATGRLRPIA